MNQYLKLSASFLLAASMLAGCTSTSSSSSSASEEKLSVLTGEADGYGGTITATVTVDADGTIKDLALTGENETPTVGGEALPVLQENIIAAGTIEGVDGVSGATWTSTGVFNAIKDALGIEVEEAVEDAKDNEPVAASGMKAGIGVVSTPRLGPGKDATETPVYSLNEVVAYVLLDKNDRIVDLEVDIVEFITPNHGEKEDNILAVWPGQSYNADMDFDGTIEGVLEETEEGFMERIPGFQTKREKGSAYKLNSGTFEDEMDIYEDFFTGMDHDEIIEAVETLFSDVNGRPLNGNSTNDEDVAKREALSDEELAEIDTLAGATISINDSHGDMVSAILLAMDNAEEIASDEEIASIGLGIETTPRLGPGKDDQEVSVYSFNVVVAGTALNADEEVIDTRVDILEIITPNHDGAHDNRFTGWPGQSYNGDKDGDSKVDGAIEQTEETFLEQTADYQTKRMLGNNYKLNSGTFADEMDIYQSFFAGKTADEIQEAFDTLFSDVNGRPLNGNSTNDEDVAKREALSDEELEEIDTLAGATISISDSHGDMLGAILESIANAK